MLQDMDHRPKGRVGLAVGGVAVFGALGLFVALDGGTSAESSVAAPAVEQATQPVPVDPPPAAEPTPPPGPTPAPVPEPPPGEHDGVLGKDQTLGAALGQLGVSPQEVHGIVSALEGVYDFRDARPGARFQFKRDPGTGALLSFEFEHGPLDIFRVAPGPDGALKGSRVEVQVDRTEAEVGATIRSSLYAAMQSAGESPALIGRVTDVFAWDVDFFKDTRPGDRFKVIVEKLHKDGEFIRYGRILAAEYAGATGTFRTFWFQAPGEEIGNYYLEDGQSARKLFLATPLKYVRVSSGFNKKRRHPVLGYTKAHNGVDYAAPTGTPVRAMADGKVTFAKRKGPNGNLVRIKHDNGLTSAYAHLHRIGRGIKAGVRVRQKQVIGTVGATGRATGPHLHFGVRRGNKWLNPQTLKMTRAKGLPSKHMPAFKALVARRLERLAAIQVQPFAEPPSEAPADAR